ncbi:MAG: hypothetical protein HYS53_02010 [Candidatus Aenigmarchaeota archaeon]|nr:hypothetical protein [Candidatus Aenigmarchaeota archaeon]
MFKVQYPWKYQWKHKNLVLIFLSTALAVYVLTTPEIAGLIEHSGNLGYFGAFIAGLFFSSLFTTPLATVTLALLGKTMDPFLLASIGASGAMIADFVIFRIVRKSVDDLSQEIIELKIFIERHNPVHFNPKNRVLHELKIHIAPILAGFIIASPLPDEIAIGMLGAAHYDQRKILAFSFVANFLGILALAYIGRSVL